MNSSSSSISNKIDPLIKEVTTNVSGSSINATNATSVNATTSTPATIMEVFLSTQEIYLYKVLNFLISILGQTYEDFSNSYSLVAQVVFYVFLAFQIVTLLYLRSRFISTLNQDVMQSRGILNLIPQSFFKDHQEAVERVIKLMRK